MAWIRPTITSGVTRIRDLFDTYGDAIDTTHTEIDGRLSQEALAQSYAPLSDVPADYTYDATTGSIKTIVEHYPAPIGNRTTTYGGYNAVGDPTTEIDPDGVNWVLAYDAAGNPTSRTVAP